MPYTFMSEPAAPKIVEQDKREEHIHLEGARKARSTDVSVRASIRSCVALRIQEN